LIAVSDSATAPLDFVLSGVVNIALSVEMVGQWGSLIKYIDKTLYNRLDVVAGVCPDEAVLHRTTIVKYFVIGGGQESKQLLIDGLAAGDWRDPEHILIYVPPGTILNPPTIHKIKQNAARGVTAAITSEHWKPYKRKKLARGEKAICDIALPCLLGVLPPAYKDFARSGKKKQQPLPLSPIMARMVMLKSHMLISQLFRPFLFLMMFRLNQKRRLTPASIQRQRKRHWPF